MKILNLTPRPLTLVGENGTLEVPPSGRVARLGVTRTACSPVTVDGVTLTVSRPQLGDIVGLPAPEPWVLLVVSAMVAEAAGRADVMSPGELLHDGAGNVIGARGLCAYGREQE